MSLLYFLHYLHCAGGWSVVVDSEVKGYAQEWRIKVLQIKVKSVNEPSGLSAQELILITLVWSDQENIYPSPPPPGQMLVHAQGYPPSICRYHFMLLGEEKNYLQSIVSYPKTQFIGSAKRLREVSPFQLDKNFFKMLSRSTHLLDSVYILCLNFISG